MPVGLVLVAHVAELAEGVRVLAAQMAPGIAIAAAGGTDEGGIGTSFDKVLAAVLEVDDGSGVALLYDLGSAQMTAELVTETLDPDQAARVRIVDAPLVEGSLAAATTAAGNASLDAVVAAAEAAATGRNPNVEAAGAGPGQEPVEAAPRLTASRVLHNAAGLHARPAAELARLVGRFDARVQLGRPDGPGVEVRSVLGVVALGLRVREEVAVSASGPQAKAALDAVVALVDDGFGEREAPAVEPPAEPRLLQPPETQGVTPAEVEGAPPAERPGILHGVPASPGVAVGPVHHLRRTEPAFPHRPHVDGAAERRRLEAAIAQVEATLHRRAVAGGPDADLAAAHQAMLADPILRDGAEQRIRAGLPAEAAWWQGIQAAGVLLAGGDAYVQERAADVEEVGRAVLAELGVDTRPAIHADDVAGAIVVADELLPTDVLGLAEAGVAGVAVARGGRTAHATLLARGLAVPLAVRLGRAVLEARDGVPALLDGDAGTLRIDPSESERGAADDRSRARAAATKRHRVEAAPPVVLAGGRRILVTANVGSLAEARAAVAAGANGVGLLRTELLWIGRPVAPDEDEQAAELVEILEVLGERPAVVRTLDVGGDKLLPALDLDPWRHGPLGVRGIRYAFDHPNLLRTQLRAVLRAAATANGEVSVMAPMVTLAAEARAFRECVDAVAGELVEEGVAAARPARVGVMVEVPAAALAAAEICAEVDFVSVGSNDLAQYVLAADRTNDAVGHLYQPEHPALWRLYEDLVAAAAAAGCAVAVCGEVAGDPDMARRLVDLGVTELSMAPASVPAVKAALRGVQGPPPSSSGGGDRRG